MPSHTPEERRKRRLLEQARQQSIPNRPILPPTRQSTTPEVQRQQSIPRRRGGGSVSDVGRNAIQRVQRPINRGQEPRVPLNPIGKSLSDVTALEARQFATNAQIQQANRDRGIFTQEDLQARGLTEDQFLEQVRREEQGLDPTQIEQQFESEGGFQELPSGRIERVAQRGAELGLAVPITLGNQFTKLIEKVSGREFGRTDIEEIAKTPEGQLLGLSITALASATLLTATATAVTGFVSGVIGNVATSLGVSKGAIAGGLLIGAGTITGFKSDDVVNKILDRKQASEIQSSVNTLGMMGTSVEGIVNSGGITKTEGLARINQLQRNINIVESEIQQAVILDPRVRVSGQLTDITADLQDQKLVLEESRAGIIASVPEFNIVQITSILARMQEIEKGRRQELIEQGAIKEVI